MDKKVLKMIDAMKRTDPVMIYDKKGKCWPTGKRELSMPKEEAEELLEIAAFEVTHWIPFNNRD